MTGGLQLPLTPLARAEAQPSERHGVVYTRPWVAELILDLAGYRSDEDLVRRFAVEPAAGDGAFLRPMVIRLVASCRRQGLPLHAIAGSLRAYEVDRSTAATTRAAIAALLIDLGVPASVAEALAHGWVQCGDYLLEWHAAPPADFVIGNPPYIRLEDVPESLGAAYRAMYHTMAGRADIYVGFFQAALSQLKPGGVCGFICADRWMLNHYGTELRRLITGSYSLDIVIGMNQADAFQSRVSAYPAITIIRNVAQGPVIVASATEEAGTDGAVGRAAVLRASATNPGVTPPPRGLRAARVDQWFSGGDPWPQTSPDRLALLRRLESQFGPLEDSHTDTRVFIGVATGADDVFITRDATIVEQSRLLPLAMAHDTKAGTVRWSGHHLVNPWESDGRLVDLAGYPRLRAYFEQHRPVIATRHIAQKNPHQWYRTIDRVHHGLTSTPKLYLPDIKGVIHPVLDDGATYPHHNLYVIYASGWDMEVLGGLLLSSVAQFFIECYAVRMRGGWLRFQAQYLRRIRVPCPAAISPDLKAQLKAAFRARDVALADAVAFQLYRLAAIPKE